MKNLIQNAADVRVVVILTGMKLKACLCSILLSATRFDSTGLDWGSVKTVSSCKDLRDIEIDVDSEPRPQICVQIISLITKHCS